MSAQEEKKNKRIALITSISIHGLLLIAFFLMMAWRAPNPPLPEYGIELNFGMDQTGGGEIQPEKSPGTPEKDNAPQVEEKVETAQPKEQVKEEVVSEKTVEPIVSKTESPVVVKEAKKEQPKEVVKEKVVETKPKVTPNEEVKKEDKKEVKVTEQKGTDARKGDPTTSQGDQKGKEGDAGNPEGKLDAKALYGNQGGGANGDKGFGLSMGGWEWASPPKIPLLPDNEDGRIEFEIECDDNGDIVGITTLQRGLSPRAEQLLKAEIMRNSLRRTSDGQVPERSKGKVVFILKTK
ncbi:MAG: cell envelope integrity protein TolA [Cyclobacteriaceae bacterium]|nr:cell envelope integrity protein TolA [Cyclobacteriaceae bacterium]